MEAEFYRAPLEKALSLPVLQGQQIQWEEPYRLQHPQGK